MNRVVLLFSLMLASASASATTYTVNSIFDTPDSNPGDNVCEATSGGTQCTLRAAIEEANSDIGFDSIEFSLGLIVINISGSPLPSITSFMTIDGTTAPNYSAGQTYVISAPPSVYINGSALTGTTADGFRLVSGAGASTIRGIGIIGFPDNGIEVANADSITIDSNWIGTGRTGGIAGNTGSGVYLNNCDNCKVGQTINQVGPALVGRGNLISNNGEDGVFLIVGENNTIIAGNYIGLDPFTDADHGNGGHGVHLQGPNVRVGHSVNGLNAPNFITNNNGSGIRTSTGGQLIYTNQIYRNGNNGVILNGGSSNIGFTNPVLANRIFNNTGHGVVIGNDFASSSNLVQNNFIYENTQRGVQISLGSSNVVSNNQIFDNLNDGVRIDAASNTVGSNRIGLENNTIKGNAFNGIVINSGSNTVDGNTIATVDDDGIDIVTGSGNQVNSNNIGVGTGGIDYGNGANGIRVRAAASNTSISNNRIGHNNQDGVRLEGGGSTLCGNRIGLGAALEAAANALKGVRILGGGNRVGGLAVVCAGNDIGHNLFDGVHVEGATNIIRDNFIGRKDANLFGNGTAGMWLTNAASQSEIMGNVFGDNNEDAIRLSSTAGTRNRIQENRFELNGATAGDLGIDILSNGVTPNDVNDADAGTNNIQNTPELLVVLMSPDLLEITYRMTSSISNSTYPITVDFYRGFTVSVGPGLSKEVEGQFVYRDVYNLAPNTSKVVAFDPMSLSGFGTIMAQATDAEGNSSEFSFAVPFNVNVQPGVIFKDGFEDP
jgi:CSLREA domain-containing protein